ncbi:hypothetical protein [Ruminiclostridium josui]|uniref:hypothetical protein n=1 Tax=Ruminiclostridium josui TaxID=1499 RepID=UPI000466A280|nr:hypothetical protein [Ruminiclostridium josui]
MKKAELNEILKLKKEVKQLNQKLQELNYGDDETVVSDKVRGSMSEYPYSARSFNLVGREQMSEKCIQKRNEIGKKISDKYYELNCKISKALDYINTISDSEIRTIYRYRFIDGQEWKEIGLYMNYDESTVRRKCRAWENKNK